LSFAFKENERKMISKNKTDVIKLLQFTLSIVIFIRIHTTTIEINTNSTINFHFLYIYKKLTH
jgi:hypothetical protein